MKAISVKDLMIRIEDYATVSEEATLFDAIIALEEAQKTSINSQYKHRAVLVYDKKKRVVGKVSQLDAIRALEPNYEKMGDFKAMNRYGFTSEFTKSLIENYGLWAEPMRDICKKASQVRVKDIMYTPTEGEYVSEEATLDQAIHLLVLGHHQSLLVVRGKDIVGILRLTDVFLQVSECIKECSL